MAFDRLLGTLPQLSDYSQLVKHKRKTYIEPSTNCQPAVDSLMERLRQAIKQTFAYLLI
nr:MAG TPA: hypothetical protein [Caudoviricetes sp.]